MIISFNPAVDQTVPISVLPGANAVQLHFTATISSSEAYNEFKRDGGRIEVWSDIPVRGRVVGEWGELSFEESPLNKVARDSDDSSLGTVSLLSGDSDADQDSKEHTLRLDCTLPLVGRTRFAYTYRLVYPNGEIEWLGQFGQNGVLAIGRVCPKISLGEGWRLGDETTETRLWRDSGGPVDVEVARLDKKDYSIWAIGKERSINDPTSADSSVVFFVPLVRADCVSFPQTFVLSASAGSSISVTPLGGITFKTPGGGSLLLKAYNPSLDPQTFVETIISHSGISPMRLLGYDATEPPSHLVLTSPENIYPISAALIPLSPTPSSSLEVCVSLHSLSALLPSASHLCIASPFRNTFHYFAVPPEPAGQKIAFVVNATRCQFILAPAHCLVGECSTWYISVLTPYTPAIEPESKLPTPPSSPKLYPVVPRDISSMLVPSLLDLDGDGDEVTRPPLRTPGLLGPYAEASAQGSSMVATRTNLGNSVMLYARYFFTMAAIFQSLVAILFPFLHNNGMHEQIPPSRENAHTPESVEESESGMSHADSNVSKDIQAEAISPSDSSAQHNGHSRTDLVPEVSAHTSPSPGDSSAQSEVELKSPPLFMDILGGTVSVALRALRSSASPDEIGLELNGITVDRSVEKHDDGGSYSLKFSAGENGGRVKIFAKSV